jgi:hypothetical protein
MYGIDTSKPITPVDVRDAIVECFLKAHSEIIQQSLVENDSDLSRDYVERIVRKSFEETGGNFDAPTKESIIAAMKHLEAFAANFRGPEIVEKHYGEMMNIVYSL